MPKRPHDAQLPASEDLLKRFKAAASDVVRLCEIIGSTNSTCIAGAVFTPIAGGSSSAPDDSKPPRKTVFTDGILVDSFMFLNRFHLDALLFTCKLTQNLVTCHMQKDCLRHLCHATIRRHPRGGGVWLRAESECYNHCHSVERSKQLGFHSRLIEKAVTNEEANEFFCNI
ncbi:hypothetical protein AAVH_39437, partial [Aphelenchoides avenae]